MSLDMKSLLISVVLLTLAAAPFAHGKAMHYHGAASTLSVVGTGHHHSCDHTVGFTKFGCDGSEMSQCCGVFAGHCSSVFNHVDGSASDCPMRASLARPGWDSSSLVGVGPEADTPPPRI